MLAGYLPFDDDPANPEGDNINLLYKYIVNTPLTFPEYVTPHARDLLRRILVPSPRKRADLFEVARHSWLNEYAHVVELITSTTTTTSEIQNTTVPADDMDTAGLARSASVREPHKAKTPAVAAVGDLARKQGKVDAEEGAYSKQQKDNKRRTVQVEYVAPTTQTQRGGEPSDIHGSPRGKTRARTSSQEPVEVQASPQERVPTRDGPSSRDGYASSPSQMKPSSAHRNQNVPQPRTTPSRATAENAYMTVSGTTVPRPATGGSMNSMTGSRAGVTARASYGQPLPPAVADTNAHGSIQQPKGGAKNYVISNPIPQETSDMDFGRPSITVPSKFAEVSGFNQGQKQSGEAKGHRRSNTIGEIGGKIFGRSGSIFGGRKKRVDQQAAKEARKYPPVSMSNTMPGDSRTSMDSRASRRSFSLGLGKKRSGSVAGSQASFDNKPKSRRFSLIRAMGLSKEPPASPTADISQQDLPIQDPPDVDEYGRYLDQPPSGGNQVQQYPEAVYDEPQESPRLRTAPQSSHSQRLPQHERYAYSAKPSPIPPYLQGAVLNSGSESSSIDQPQRRPPNSAPYQTGYDSDQYDPRRYEAQSRVLHKNKRFTDAYEREYGRPHDHAGSSGAAKRVMDFFRRRGRARGGEA